MSELLLYVQVCMSTVIVATCPVKMFYGLFELSQLPTFINSESIADEKRSLLFPNSNFLESAICTYRYKCFLATSLFAPHGNLRKFPSTFVIPGNLFTQKRHHSLCLPTKHYVLPQSG